MRKGSKMTLEQRKKLSKAHKGYIPWNKGKKGLFKHTEEWKRKRGEANKGKNNPFYGKRHSGESRKKMSEAHKGKIPSNLKDLKKYWQKQENRKKKSIQRRGHIPWNKGLKGVQVSWMKGKHHTKEAKRKNRLAHLGKPAWNKGKKTGAIPWNKGKKGTLHHTEEAKLKIRESRAKQIFPIKDSKPEKKIQNFLKQLGITFLTHKYIKEIEHSYQCDIFIPSMNLIIECDGDYWHGNINNPKFKILNKYQIDKKELDSIRTKELMEKNFKVLRIWESNINKMDFNDFKNKLFSSTL